MLTLLCGVPVRCGPRRWLRRLAADKAALDVRVAGLAAQVEHLTQTVATLSGLLFGDSSEKRNPGQQPGGGEDGHKGDGRARSGGRGQRKGSRGHGRRSYAHLETEERIIDVEPGLRRCRCCGTDFEFLGTEDSEQLDWEVRLRRVLWRRRRYRRRCQCPAKLAGRIAVCAPRPPKVIPKGLFTAMFLARLAYEKYVLGWPLHRIIAALAADGLDVAEGTLVGALQQVAPLLAPWAEAIEAHVAASGYVRADETGWRVFADTPGKDGNRWWLWVFGTDEATVFAMDPSRSAEVPAKVLGIDREQAALEAGRRLVISSDFYGVYQSLASIEGIDPLWCFAHIRRYFLRPAPLTPMRWASGATPGRSGSRCCTGRTPPCAPRRPRPRPRARARRASRPWPATTGPSITSTQPASRKPRWPACCTRPRPRSSPR